MRIAVVIAPTQRPEILSATLTSLESQRRPADEIIVSVAEQYDLPANMPAGAKSIISDRGASKQRNFGVAALAMAPDIVAFLDDDLILHRDYLLNMESIFARKWNAALVMGHLLANGEYRSNGPTNY
jgi:cellulose synthase/poly-beta-1,6-N-acetylglucosamine synthase-like glycosyltransferase